MYFHVSYADLGERVTLTAKVPECANHCECQQTKRVCFSPTVWQCLIGKTGSKQAQCIISELLGSAKHKVQDQWKNPAVYATQQKLFVPDSVSDFALTGEAWSLKDIAVSRKGFVDLKKLLMTGKVELTKHPLSLISESFVCGWRHARCIHYETTLQEINEQV